MIVATPEINPRKLSATLSLLRTPEALPFNMAIALPLFTLLPSLIFFLNLYMILFLVFCKVWITQLVGPYRVYFSS